MHINQSQDILMGILMDKGIDPELIGLKQALEAFRIFSAADFDCADDLLLWEAGTFDLGDGPQFLCTLARQFSVEEDGEYDHMEQLHLELLFDPADLPPNLEAALWSSDCGDSFPAFFEAVENTPAFRLLASGHRPLGCKIYLEAL